MTLTDRRSRWLMLLILFQAACTLFFIGDVMQDIGGSGWRGLVDAHLLPELGATLGLVLGIVVEARALQAMLGRAARLERGIGIAAGALDDLMQAHFRDWALTASEADIATFTIKGYSIAEVAGMRGSSAATVKTHLNAIYRKAGVAGRAQLVSILIEDLMRAPLMPAAGPFDRPAQT